MKKPKETKKEITQEPEKKVIFQKMNYILFFVGLAVIILGFLLMIGGGSDNPDVFNEKMFGFQRLTLAPILLILGFAIEFFAIFYKPKKKNN
ncbi:MAG: DUF3098 domain-containing protein [Bacteroidales bacterium]|jgi:pilus assembly protein TadC|nr:DUF3098 domain-containing protein [Bacteroidales bacterium]